MQNHRIPDYSLLEIFYRALDANAKTMADTITGGAFMKNSFEEATETLKRVTKTNRAWHTRETKASRGTYAAGSTVDQMRMNEELRQEVPQMRAEVSIFAIILGAPE